MLWVLIRIASQFLWRTDENYLSAIIKYPPYLFHCLLKGIRQPTYFFRSQWAGVEMKLACKWLRLEYSLFIVGIKPQQQHTISASETVTDEGFSQTTESEIEKVPEKKPITIPDGLNEIMAESPTEDDTTNQMTAQQQSTNEEVGGLNENEGFWEFVISQS